MQPDKTQFMNFIPISAHVSYSNKIKPLLQKLKAGNFSIDQLLKTLKEFKFYSSASKRKFWGNNEQTPEYSQLKYLSKKQDIAPLFSKMAEHILKLQQHFKHRQIRILKQKTQGQIQFTKEEILYLMSLMAMNLVPLQYYDQNPTRRAKFPNVNDFGIIFTEQQFKTRTIIQYFKQHFTSQQWKKQNEKFIIRRKVLTEAISQIIKKNYHQPMVPYELKQDDDSIESYYGQVKTDFANKYIGGGALTHGCVQEEIMFANHPELFTSVIFCEVMDKAESLFFDGYRKYSKNTGYGWTIKYSGQENIDFSKKEYVIAIDAVHFPKNNTFLQFQRKNIDRELTKAFAGFSNTPENTKIVTGNWGCGAFNGDVRTKFLIQWLACSMARKTMVYCPFGQKNRLKADKDILDELGSRKIGEVYELLIEGARKMQYKQDNILRRIGQFL